MKTIKQRAVSSFTFKHLYPHPDGKTSTNFRRCACGRYLERGKEKCQQCEHANMQNQETKS